MNFGMDNYAEFEGLGVLAEANAKGLIAKGDARKKILIIGHGRHGKDTLAEIWHEGFKGFTFDSSSQAASRIFLYNTLKPILGYKSANECFEDRVNHRALWYELIKAYNSDDHARLAKEILSKSDCYVGMRSRMEIVECLNQNLFDLIIWVDASSRLGYEDESSFDIDRSLADIIIDNNGTLESFRKKAMRLGAAIGL